VMITLGTQDNILTNQASFTFPVTVVLFDSRVFPRPESIVFRIILSRKMRLESLSSSIPDLEG
jgi:hypothetical protein